MKNVVIILVIAMLLAAACVGCALGKTAEDFDALISGMEFDMSDTHGETRNIPNESTNYTLIAEQSELDADLLAFIGEAHYITSPANEEKDLASGWYYPVGHSGSDYLICVTADTEPTLWCNSISFSRTVFENTYTEEYMNGLSFREFLDLELPGHYAADSLLITSEVQIDGKTAEYEYCGKFWPWEKYINMFAGEECCVSEKANNLTKLPGRWYYPTGYDGAEYLIFVDSEDTASVWRNKNEILQEEDITEDISAADAVKEYYAKLPGEDSKLWYVDAEGEISGRAGAIGESALKYIETHYIDDGYWVYAAGETAKAPMVCMGTEDLYFAFSADLRVPAITIYSEGEEQESFFFVGTSAYGMTLSEKIFFDYYVDEFLPAGLAVKTESIDVPEEAARYFMECIGSRRVNGLTAGSPFKLIAHELLSLRLVERNEDIFSVSVREAVKRPPAQSGALYDLSAVYFDMNSGDGEYEGYLIDESFYIFKFENGHLVCLAKTKDSGLDAPYYNAPTQWSEVLVIG